jgi:hypothetical protein
VQVDHVGTDRQLANALTNPLGRIRFFELGQRQVDLTRLKASLGATKLEGIGRVKIPFLFKIE